VQELPHVLKGNEDTEIKIAAIFFAYDNSELLLALDDRGTKLSNGQFKQNLVIENKIKKLIEDKMNKFIRPVSAFIMFNSQEG